MKIISFVVPTKDEVEDLVKFESECGFLLPKDLREFLLKHSSAKPLNSFLLSSDGGVNTDIQVFYGLGNQPEINNIFFQLQVFSSRIPSYFLPFARDSFGNQFLINLREEYFGNIYFWNHEGELNDGDASEYFENVTWLSDSFELFCLNLSTQV